MNRLDRALGILLLLRGGKSFSATQLSRRFEVSTRTIYRDVEALCAIGVPIYAEMGRGGGFRLVEGYFLPPVMFSVGEAISLLLGLTLLRSLRARPFATEVDTSEQKLLAVVPDHLRAALAKAQQIIGFERMPIDVFHPERSESEQLAGAPGQGAIVSAFLQAILDRRAVALDYRSPYAAAAERMSVTPLGLVWDRDRWYLAGRQARYGDETRLWRADRVLALKAGALVSAAWPPFDVDTLLGHSWLRQAMERWSQESPVVIRLTRAQAERLGQDWYYRHARFEQVNEHQVDMTFGEDDRAKVLDLVRWLGPGAELIRPAEWRPAIQAELAAMLAVYADP
jgi:predicted DNA-binding transcriptional regulator YafY